MVRPTNLARERELLTAESTAGTFDGGGNGDWTTAPDSPSLIVEESDGSPSVANVGSLIFDAAGFTVTDNSDGSVTIDALASASAELNIEGGQSVIKAHGSTGSTETIDPTDGNVHTLTLDADCTITLNAPSGSGACTLELWVTEDGTGGRTITWPGSVTEQGTHTTTASTTQRVILETIDGGTSWIATWIGSSSASFATPAIVLGSSAAAGAASTVIRSDATIAAFDATAPVTQAFGDAAATGSAAYAARRDHKHGMPSAPSSGSDHEHIANVVFSGDGSTTVWELPAAPVDSTSIAVYVTGSRSIAWALSGALLTTLTFDSAPASAANNIVIDIVAAVA